MFLEIVIGLHPGVEVSLLILLLPMWWQEIKLSMTRLLELSRPVHKFDITLLVARSRCYRHRVFDTHRVACVVGQSPQTSRHT